MDEGWRVRGKKSGREGAWDEGRRWTSWGPRPRKAAPATTSASARLPDPSLPRTAKSSRTSASAADDAASARSRGGRARRRATARPKAKPYIMGPTGMSTTAAARERWRVGARSPNPTMPTVALSQYQASSPAQPSGLFVGEGAGRRGRVERE